MDVSNFGGRVDAKEAQLVLGTRYDTQIRWGQPPSSKNFFIEIPTAQKLASLKAIWSEYSRVDAKRPWIDIRFDKVTYPNDAAQASGR